MKPLRKRLEEVRKNTGLPWEIIERDYILSWILAGIGVNKKLHGEIIFKGGTALKKCYFGDYRFSEDLDFTAKENLPRQDELEKEIQEVCKSATELVQEYSPLELRAEKYTEKEPHPGGQEAFIIKGKFPWHREFMVKAMIEITVDEPIKTEPKVKKIIHGYGEKIYQEIFVYSLEEIVAEKMRALLQHLQKLKNRGWSRSRARDYYDLWKIFTSYPEQLNLEILQNIFLEKCKVREVDFKGPEEFFDKTLITYVAKTWEQSLDPLVPDLPSFKLLIDNLKKRFFDIFRK
jgi:predicted nucleotidyltransferase component of viral defense system